MDTNKKVAVTLIRLLLGLIFLMQGYGKVFTYGVENLYNMDFFHGTYKDLLPDFVTRGTAYFTSYTELIAGFLLTVGLLRDYALYALAAVLVVVTFGHGLAEPIWDLSHVMFRTILLLALLLLPSQWDCYGLDSLLQQKRSA